MDTSKAMRPRANAVQKTVSNLLLSGMHAQLQRGDTIGVWTYNETLYAGRLPLQQWSPEDEQLVTSNIVVFLKAQPYEKTSHFDKVWPVLQSLVRESEKLTVLLVSDGDENISGTPFDREINEFFKQNSRSQAQKRMPFVIVLRSYRGKFIGATLNLAPWPAEFSPFPPEPKVSTAPKTKSPPEKTAPAPTVPSLIVIGKKPETAPVTPAAPIESTPAKSTATTDVLPSAAVETSSPPAPAATVEPKPDVAQAAATPAEPVIMPEPPPIELPKPETGPVIAKPESSLPSPPAVAPPTQPPLASPPPANPETTLVVPPALADDVKPESFQPAATEQPPPTTQPAQVATATQPETFVTRTNLGLIGVGVLVLMGAVIFFMQRRACATTHASLITRSMDKDKK